MQAVSEAAVVGYPHDIKGQGIYAYVTLMTGKEPSEALRKELVAWVRKEIGPIASPDLIQFAPGLPKTRSGKIMRRILRKIAEDEPSSLGDTSTLADPAVVDDLVAEPAEQEGRCGLKPDRFRSRRHRSSRFWLDAFPCRAAFCRRSACAGRPSQVPRHLSCRGTRWAPRTRAPIEPIIFNPSRKIVSRRESQPR